MLILFAKLGPMFVKKMLNSLAMFCSLFTLFPLTIISSIVVFFRLALDNTSEIVFHVFLMSYLYF